MADTLKLRGGTTSQNNSFTGSDREVTVDTTKKTLVVHDGSTAGGSPLMKESGGNSAQTVSIGTGGTNAINIDNSQQVGIGVTDVKAALQVNSSKNAETDRHDGSNYHLFLRNPDDDAGEACGLAFSVTSNATKTGAAIMHEREGGGSLGGLQFYTNGDGNSVTERMRITSTGDVEISDGNLVLANGHGIDFSAVSDGSRTVTSNLLDDYEEGTFTPTLTTATTTSTPTYNSQVGVYTKIGNFVFYQIYIRLSAKDGGSGDLRVSSLPFTASTTAYGGAVIAYTYNWDDDALDRALIGANSDEIQLFVGTSNGTNVAATAGNLNNDTQIRIFGSYKV